MSVFGLSIALVCIAGASALIAIMAAWLDSEHGHAGAAIVVLIIVCLVNVVVAATVADAAYKYHPPAECAP